MKLFAILQVQGEEHPGVVGALVGVLVGAPVEVGVPSKVVVLMSSIRLWEVMLAEDREGGLNREAVGGGVVSTEAI